MAITKYLIPAVAFASSALAQCSTSATLTLSAAADATSLAACTTYSGSVTVPSDAAFAQGQGGQSLSIDTIEKITNNLTIVGAANLATIEFGSLKSIGGFTLGALTVLSDLSMPQLTTVDSMNFTALPALQQLSFGNTGLTQASSILISNTGLSSLMGINNLESVNTFNVNNNGGLQNISLQVTNIKGALDIEANDGFSSGLTTSFPMLETAMNMTFRNCSSVSLPSLANVSQYLGFYGNTMQSFIAPNLTTTGGLVFVDNTQLTNISIPQLVSVNGSYQIANNTMLKQINGFEKLSTIKSSLDFNGNFTDVELPGLTQVSGAFNLQTSANFDCSGFQADKSSKNIIKGNFVCSGSVTKPGGAGTKPSSTGGSGPNKSSAADPAAIPALPALMGATSIFAGLLQFIL